MEGEEVRAAIGRVELIRLHLRVYGIAVESITCCVHIKAIRKVACPIEHVANAWQTHGPEERIVASVALCWMSIFIYPGLCLIGKGCLEIHKFPEVCWVRPAECIGCHTYSSKVIGGAYLYYGRVLSGQRFAICFLWVFWGHTTESVLQGGRRRRTNSLEPITG